MLKAACRPGWDEISNLADAMARHAFAEATAGAFEFDPEIWRRAAALELATVQDVEDALQALGRQVGADRAENVRLTLLRGMRDKMEELLELAAE